MAITQERQLPQVPEEQGGRERARWTRLAMLGFALVASGPLMFLISALAFGLDMSEDVGFFAVILVVPILGFVLVRLRRTWPRIIAIVAALFAAMSMFWTPFGLAYPQSFFDFYPAVVVVPGALLAVVATIASIVAKRRGHMTTTATGGERRTIAVVLAVVAVAALVSGVWTIAGSGNADEAAAAGRVEMKDFEFTQDGYAVSSGQSLLIRNDDPWVHTFTVDELGIDVTLTAGAEELVQIEGSPGEYRIYCKPHAQDENDEDSMEATLRVS